MKLSNPDASAGRIATARCEQYNTLSSYCPGFEPVHEESERIVLKIWQIGLESVKPPSTPPLYRRRLGFLLGVARKTTAWPAVFWSHSGFGFVPTAMGAVAALQAIPPSLGAPDRMRLCPAGTWSSGPTTVALSGRE